MWGRISVQCLSLSTVARYNRTSYFYPTFSESSEHSHLLVSPVLVASAVIGVVIILSCITIIVGSIRRDRQARLQRQRQRHRRHRRHRHRRRRRRHREYEQGYGELLPIPGHPQAPCPIVTQAAAGRWWLYRGWDRVVRLPHRGPE